MGPNSHAPNLVCTLLASRCHDGDGPPFKVAIGPWHALAHNANCQQRYGARQHPSLGLTFGDNPEHWWAELRRFNGVTKYMSEAGWRDFIQDLVSTLYMN